MTMNGAAMTSELGGSYWEYSYDSRGQVVGAVRRFADASAVPGLEHGIEYDDIGNRIATSASGRTNAYQANQLNQYTQRTVQGWVNLRGNADPQATVTVNNSPVQRLGSFWTTERYFTNTAADVWAELSAVGVLLGGATNGEDIVAVNTGHVFLARTPEAFAYDADGNLIQDARFRYEWDAENRLSVAETRTNLQSMTPRVRLTFAYDNQGRRVHKTVEDGYTAGAYSTTNVTTFVWDGWLPIEEAGTGFTNLTTWALDLSGGFQGAGGVGGLAAISRSGTTYFAACDGLGNVTEYVDTNGVVVAHREYDAWGESLMLAGAKCDDFAYWFSSKPLDEETDTYDFGLRVYQPGQGRFMSRDPLEVAAEPNTYAFVLNNALAAFDPLGLKLESYDQNIRDLPLNPSSTLRAGVLGLTTPTWPKSIARETWFIFSGVTIWGELKIEIQYNSLVVSDPYTFVGRDGLTVANHEWRHALMYKNWWNRLKTLTDPLEKTFCPARCARLAVDLANTADEYYAYEAGVESAQFDVDQYGGPDARNRLAQRKALRDAAKASYDASETAWRSSKCAD